MERGRQQTSTMLSPLFAVESPFSSSPASCESKAALTPSPVRSEAGAYLIVVFLAVQEDNNLPLAHSKLTKRLPL